MSTARNLGVGLLLALAVPLVAALGVFGWVTSSIPSSQAARVRGPHELVGVRAGWTYAWVVPSESGVVLVDAGLDHEAAALREELGSREVRAVLLTHGHVDHVAGLAGLGDVPVYTADGALLRGERQPRGWMARWFSRIARRPSVPKDLRDVTDGQELRIDGVRVRAISVPGHSDGAVAWLWEDVLFTGDALLGGTQLALMPPEFADDPVQAEKSLQKLLPLDFDDVADGRVGLTGAARTGLHRVVGAKVEEPTVSLRTQGEGTAGAVAERTGVYVEAPFPDARGDRVALVVFPDGDSWRVGDAPSAEHAALLGRTVTVRGRPVGSSGGRGVRVRIEEIAAVPDGPATEPVPAIAGLEPLEGRLGRWVSVSGTVRSFAPLQAGAAWGEGTIVLADGGVVDFSGPVGPSPGASLSLVARVTRDGEAIRLVDAGLSTTPP